VNDVITDDDECQEQQQEPFQEQVGTLALAPDREDLEEKQDTTKTKQTKKASTASASYKKLRSKSLDIKKNKVNKSRSKSIDTKTNDKRQSKNVDDKATNKPRRSKSVDTKTAIKRRFKSIDTKISKTSRKSIEPKTKIRSKSIEPKAKIRSKSIETKTKVRSKSIEPKERFLKVRSNSQSPKSPKKKKIRTTTLSEANHTVSESTIFCSSSDLKKTLSSPSLTTQKSKKKSKSLDLKSSKTRRSRSRLPTKRKSIKSKKMQEDFSNSIGNGGPNESSDSFTTPKTIPIEYDDFDGDHSSSTLESTFAPLPAVQHFSSMSSSPLVTPSEKTLRWICKMAFLNINDIDDDLKQRRAQLAVDAALTGRSSGFRKKDIVVEATSVTSEVKKDTWKLKKSPSEIVGTQESSSEFLTRCLHEAVTKGRIKPEIDHDYDDDDIAYDDDDSDIARGRTVEEIVKRHREQKLRSFGSQRSLRRLMLMERQESGLSVMSSSTAPTSPRASSPSPLKFRKRLASSTADNTQQLVMERVKKSDIEAAAIDRAMRLAMTEKPVVRDAKDFAIYKEQLVLDDDHDEVITEDAASLSQATTLEIVQSWITIEDETDTEEAIIDEENLSSQEQTLQIVQSWTTIEEETDTEEVILEEDSSSQSETLDIMQSWSTIEEETETTIEETEEEEVEDEVEEIREVASSPAAKQTQSLSDPPKPPSLLEVSPAPIVNLTTMPITSTNQPMVQCDSETMSQERSSVEHDKERQPPWFLRKRWLKQRQNMKHGSVEESKLEQPKIEQRRPRKKLGGAFPSWASDYSSKH
jgi:hypothetical protein